MITVHGDGCWRDGLAVTPPSSVGFLEIALSSTDKKMSYMLLICRVQVSQTMAGCGDFRALWACCPLNRWGEGPERPDISYSHLASLGAPKRQPLVLTLAFQGLAHALASSKSTHGLCWFRMLSEGASMMRFRRLC